MAIISREEVVEFTPEQMYNLVDDIEKYPQFIPWCEQADVHHRNEDEVQATLVAVGAGIHKSFTTHNRMQKNKMIEIRLVDGPFKHFEGFWRFEPIEGSLHCKVLFDLEFEFTGFLDFAFSPIFQQMTHTLVDAFAKRANQVYINDYTR